LDGLAEEINKVAEVIRIMPFRRSVWTFALRRSLNFLAASVVERMAQTGA
jgi:hypothetical protein